MCLIKDKKLSERFVRHKRVLDYIYAYKAVVICPLPLKGRRQRRQLCLWSPYWSYQYKVGANRASLFPNLKYDPTIMQVYDGIFVYTKRALTAKVIKHFSENMMMMGIIRVKCLVRDFLGKDKEGQAAFRQVYLSEEDYQKGFKIVKYWDFCCSKVAFGKACV